MTEIQRKYQREWKQRKRISDPNFLNRERAANRKYFSNHREKRNQATKEYQVANKTRGFCSICKAPKENRRRQFCNACVPAFDRAGYMKKFQAERDEKFERLNLCRACGKPKQRDIQNCDACEAKSIAKHIAGRLFYRNLVFDHYGRRCSCPGCDVTQEEFLSVDHVGGWKKVHVTSHVTRPTGKALYKWIVDQGFPDTIRIRCMNCNWAMRKGDVCPHEAEIDLVMKNILSRLESNLENKKEVTIG